MWTLKQVMTKWRLIYSTDNHGFSLQTVYRSMEGMKSDVSTLIAIRDTDGFRFGASLPESLRIEPQEAFNGSGQTFLFRLKKEGEYDSGRFDERNLFVSAHLQQARQYLDCKLR